jgi:hypothetical protein
MGAKNTKVQQSAFAFAQIELQSDTPRAFVAANYLIKAARVLAAAEKGAR